MKEAVSRLAAFGGVPEIHEREITPWPAPSDRHLMALRNVLSSGKFHRVNHPVVAALERKMSEWSTMQYARCTSSGTSAIHIAVDQIGKPGTKILTSALNWPGAVGPIVSSGLEPEFVDINFADACLDMNMALELCTDNVSGIVVTHLFGNAVVAQRRRTEFRNRGVRLIDDCAQAITAGGAGEAHETLTTDAMVFSGNGAKHLGAGEIGVLASPHAAVVDHVDVVSLSSSSRSGDRIFSPSTYGFNYRPNVFSAAIALDRMSDMHHQVAARRLNATHVARRLTALPGIRPLFRPDEKRNSFCSLPLRLCFQDLDLPNDARVRERLVALFEAEGAPVGIWLTQPVWTSLPKIKKRWQIEDFPNTRDVLQSMFYVREVAPPNSLAEMDRVVDAFEKVWDSLPHLRDYLTRA